MGYLCGSDRTALAALGLAVMVAGCVPGRLCALPDLPDHARWIDEDGVRLAVPDPDRDRADRSVPETGTLAQDVSSGTAEGEGFLLVDPFDRFIPEANGTGPPDPWSAPESSVWRVLGLPRPRLELRLDLIDPLDPDRIEPGPPAAVQ
jgi:hypothetical protein